MSRAGNRQVVSYVRRSARMRPGIRAALEAHGPRYVVTVPTADRSTSISPDAHVDWDAEFGRVAARAVEIGTGHGESIVAYAQRHPAVDVIGFEVFEPALAATVAKAAATGVTNIRLVNADGAQGVRTLLAPESVTELITYFPDPWHKSRHHKRRMVSAEFASLVASRLATGGAWRLATDWEDYALAMRRVLDAEPGLTNLHPGWAPRAEDRPMTKYEARGVAAGRNIFDLAYGRTR